MATMTMVKALNAGLARALGADPKVLLAGEDIGNLGGVFRVTEGLKAEFGGDRVIDTPLAESGIVGSCLGLALSGYRPVIEIQFDGFVFPATNQILTQVARLYHRSHGRLNVPMLTAEPGDDLATFELGSTVVLVVGGPRAREWTACRPLGPVKVGERLGSF